MVAHVFLFYLDIGLGCRRFQGGVATYCVIVAFGLEMIIDKLGT